MKIRSLLLMLVIFLSTATIANADGAHDHAPLFGGKIFVVKDIDVELVAKNDLVQIYVRDHGKPIDINGGSAKLTLLNGAGKKEYELAANKENFEIKEKFNLEKGTKVLAIIKFKNQVITARYVY